MHHPTQLLLSKHLSARLHLRTSIEENRLNNNLIAHNSLMMIDKQISYWIALW